jgi:ribosomal protein S1
MERPGRSRCAQYKGRKLKPLFWLSLTASVSPYIKQLDSDPFTTLMSINDGDAIVTGKVKTVDKGAEIDLVKTSLVIYVPAEISRDRVEDARTVLKEGDEVSPLCGERGSQDPQHPAVGQKPRTT